jgi:DNA-binding CsgD family transcriptional regulator
MEVLSPDVLSPRQKQIVMLMTRGASIKQIAETLGVGSKTVEYHWTQARKHLKINDLASVVHWALAVKFIEPLFKAEFIQVEIPTNIVKVPQGQWRSKEMRKLRKDRRKSRADGDGKYSEKIYGGANYL